MTSSVCDRYPTFKYITNDDLDFYTKASKRLGNGFSCYFRKEWSIGQWDKEFLEEEPSIALLEIYPVIIGLFIWKEKLQNSHIIFRSNNESVCHAVNSQTSSCDKMMVLIRILVLHCLRFNIELKCIHVPGTKNLIADSLS